LYIFASIIFIICYHLCAEIKLHIHGFVQARRISIGCNEFDSFTVSKTESEGEDLLQSWASTGIPVTQIASPKSLRDTMWRQGGTNAANVHSRQGKTAESIEKKGRKRKAEESFAGGQGVSSPPPTKNGRYVRASSIAQGQGG